MKRIAVIFEGNIANRLGVFNAVLNRVRHLRRIVDYDVDVHMLQVYDGAVMSRLRGSVPPADRPATVTVEDVTFNMHWFKRSWRDALMHRLFGRPPARLSAWLDGLADALQGYDLYSAHDRMGAIVARRAAVRAGVPHTITWHGASIYTDPPRDPMLRQVTCELLQGADMNFFVSRGLLAKAEELTTGFPADVLFNGASADFTRFADDRRSALRREYGVDGRKVVAFVGRFEPVKNVLMLPEIFSLIKRKYGRPLAFWTMGTGVQHEQVRRALAQAAVDCRMWGMQPLEMMPGLMNCVDVLVLPSSLEGLPLVTLEALQCGANVVASDVIGTAEGIGRENAVPIDGNFVERLTDRAVEMLEGRVTQRLPRQVSWEATAVREAEAYSALCAAAGHRPAAGDKIAPP